MKKIIVELIRIANHHIKAGVRDKIGNCMFLKFDREFYEINVN